MEWCMTYVSHNPIKAVPASTAMLQSPRVTVPPPVHVRARLALCNGWSNIYQSTSDMVLSSGTTRPQSVIIFSYSTTVQETNSDVNS
eukprot:m.201433 g.201433  ORF g.201433 m.201433 type:complete len:87 (+) comp21404_c0_seq1:2402-2662(+)